MSNDGRHEIFIAAPDDVDVRALLCGRGEAIEAGLSIIDTDLPIAGLGAVDVVAIDARRRLVIADFAGGRESGLAGRALAHARWFRDNLPIVRRMYQLWNVRWDAPPRVVWVAAAPRRGRDGAGAAEEPAADSLAREGIERIVARRIRARDGREALLLDAESPAGESSEAPGIERAAFAPAIAPALAPSPTPASRSAGPARPSSGTPRGAAPPVAPSPRAGASRMESYRRELGLTEEEFAEFFRAPGAARPAPERGVRF
jgi:hypothetical protein